MTRKKSLEGMTEDLHRGDIVRFDFYGGSYVSHVGSVSDETILLQSMSPFTRCFIGGAPSGAFIKPPFDHLTYIEAQESFQPLPLKGYEVLRRADKELIRAEQQRKEQRNKR